MLALTARITTYPVVIQVTPQVTGESDRHSNTYTRGRPDSTSQTAVPRLSWVYWGFIPMSLFYQS